MKRLAVHFLIIILMIYTIIRNWCDIISILSPFLISIIIAYLLNPIVRFLEKKGLKRSTSVKFVFLIITVLIVISCKFFVPKLIRDIALLIKSIPQYAIWIEDWIFDFQTKYIDSTLPDSIKIIIENNIRQLEYIVLSLLQKSTDNLINIFAHTFYIALIPVITFYLLNDHIYFIDQFILLIPKAIRDRILQLLNDIEHIIGKYVKGQILIALFIAILTTISLIALKIRYAIFLGIFAGLTNVIPYFGPIIGIIPTVAFALVDSFNKAVYASIAFILIQQIESDIITPKIIGESVGIHPIYVMLSLIAGAKFFGIIGLIFILPFVASMKIVLKYIVRWVKEI